MLKHQKIYKEFEESLNEIPKFIGTNFPIIGIEGQTDSGKTYFT